MTRWPVGWPKRQPRRAPRRYAHAPAVRAGGVRPRSLVFAMGLAVSKLSHRKKRVHALASRPCRSPRVPPESKDECSRPAPLPSLQPPDAILRSAAAAHRRRQLELSRPALADKRSGRRHPPPVAVAGFVHLKIGGRTIRRVGLAVPPLALPAQTARTPPAVRGRLSQLSPTARCPAVLSMRAASEWGFVTAGSGTN